MAEHKVNNNDEISISSIRASIMNTALVIFAIIQACFNFLWRYKVIILLPAILAAGLAFFIFRGVQKEYALSMIVQHNELTKRTYAESIEQLNMLATSSSYEQLAAALHTTVSIASNISSLRSYNILGAELLKDTTTTRYVPFTIVANVFNNSIADSLQQSLLDYFNNNEFLKKLKVGQKEIYEKKLSFIEDELMKLDTLKSEYNHFMVSSKSNAMFYNNAFNPADIYTKSSEYQNQKEGIQRWLNNESEPLKLIQGFKPVQSPVADRKIKLILVSVIAGLFVGSLAGLIREISRISKKAVV